MSTESPVTVTVLASEQIFKILADTDKDRSKAILRVFVQGGGCSGFQYGLMFMEGEPNPTDQTFESNGVRLVIDPISMGYLKGAEIDFQDSLMGGGFSINNPNATSTCGCGQSFSK